MDIPALNDRRKRLPLPDKVQVDAYGSSFCGKPHSVHLFPALVRKQESSRPETLIDSEQSSCFYHPNFPATEICSLSGRFICDLCATDWEGKKVSLTALEEMHAKGNNSKLETERVLWDSIALTLVILPLVLWPLMFAAFLTAPTALILVACYWRKGPTSLVRKSRIRYVIAGILAVLQIGALVAMVGGWISLL